MFVTVVYVHVKPEHVADFIESIRVNHEHSVLEPGNLRFDILQSVDDPTRFVAYEAYRDEASAKAHKETAHYLAWRDKAADWMAEPRVGVRYDGLFPVVPGEVRRRQRVVFVGLVYIHVKPDHVTDFVNSMRANYEGSVLEPGNVRFDVLQSVDDPTRFVTYMAYRDVALVEAHRETAHYLVWRDEIADWMAEPRVVVGYDGLFPSVDE